MPVVGGGEPLPLPLLGGKTGAEVTGHDEEAILETLGWLHLDDSLGMAAHVGGSVVMIGALAAGVGCLRSQWSRERAEA